MIKQLTLLDTAVYQETQTFSDWELENSECTDSLSTPKYLNYVDSESKCTTSGVVNIYSSGGTSRGKQKYFRYSWREGSRMKHCHIPGGNIDSISAKKRASLVQCEIEADRSPVEIVAFIKTLGRTTR